METRTYVCVQNFELFQGDTYSSMIMYINRRELATENITLCHIFVFSDLGMNPHRYQDMNGRYKRDDQEKSRCRVVVA